MSVINPVDVSALRVPGSELREAFRPVGMAWASFDFSSNVSIEGFYEYEWEPIVVDPPGTYFSTNDFVGLGGEYVFLQFAAFPDTGESPWFMDPPLDIPFMSVPRTDTQDAKDDGQYGLAQVALLEGDTLVQVLDAWGQDAEDIRDVLAVVVLVVGDALVHAVTHTELDALDETLVAG